MMSNETRKPTHRLVRYYGKGQNAPRSEVGAIWTNSDGSLSVGIDTLEEQIWRIGLEIREQQEA